MHILSPETDKGPSNQWEGENDFTNVCCPSSFRKIARKEKKSVYKINENDLKIAWKCTLRQSNFKNFQGEVPRTPLIRGTLLLYSRPFSRLPPLDHAFSSQCPLPSSDLLGPALMIVSLCQDDRLKSRSTRGMRHKNKWLGRINHRGWDMGLGLKTIKSYPK